jgi:hypothetical protein
VLLGFVDEVFPVEQADVLRAAEIVQHPQALSAREALHLSIMEGHQVAGLMGVDSDFGR